MKLLVSQFALTAVILCVFMPSGAMAADPADGVAVAIVYDTSGSMRDRVRDRNGRQVPKYKIANQALETIARQLEAFSTNAAAGAPRRIDAGLFTFDGEGTREVVAFGPLKAQAMVQWARQFSNPGSGTPLGTAVLTAGRKVLASDLPHKHVLVITDGINTVGQAPEVTLPRLQRETAGQASQPAIHFVAFDVDAKVFAPLKKLGVTVVGAADEKQLGAQLDFIVKRKILLEEEELPKTK